MSNGVKLSITSSDMLKIGKRIIDAMNDAQTKDGFAIDDVLVATLYVLGGAIGQRGTLQLDAPLTKALPPLVAGYKDQLKV